MSNKLLATLSFVAAIALTIPFVARTENISPLAPTNVTPIEPMRVAEARAMSDDEPRVVSLQVNPSGFEPAETIAPRGRFLILLQNRTGQRDLSFYLIRENQEKLAESDSHKRDWKADVQLGPGIYIVGETNHLEWRSIIRVTN